MKKNAIILIFISLSLVILGFLTIFNLQNATAIGAFRSVFSSNRNITFTVVYIAVIPFLFINKYCDQVINKADRQYYIRLPFWKVQSLNIGKCFRSAFVSSLIVHLFLAVLIHLFIAPFEFDTAISVSPYFSSNILIELVVYILFSSLGLGIYMVFCYCLIDFVKNKYIYRVVPLLFMVSQVMVYPALIMMFNFISFPYQSIVLSALIPTGLFAPGTMLEGYGAINFLSSVSVYFYMILVLLFLMKKKREKYG